MVDIDSNLPDKDAADGTVGSTVPTIATQIGGSDGTNLRSIKVDSSGIVSVSTNDTSPANGSITALDVGTTSLVGANGQIFYFGTPTTNSSAVFAINSIENVSIESSILGTGGTLVVEVSMDNQTFWTRPNVYQISTQSYSNSFILPFIGILNVTAMTHIRVRAITSWSGTATIIVKESVNSRTVTVIDALPSGSNTIGSVNNISGTISLPNGAATSANQTTEITSLQLIDNTIGPVTPGTVATNSSLIGGQFNTVLPTLTNTQQVSIQLDSSGRTIISPLTNISIIKAQLEDNSGNTINADNGQILSQDTIGTSGQYRAQSVTTSAAEALGAATILTNRKFISITPTNGTVFWGFNSSVTVSSGTPIFKNQTFTLSATDAVHIFVIAGSTIDCRIAEGS